MNHFGAVAANRVTEVFVLAQRFDFATFDHSDPIRGKGAVDEPGLFVTQDEHPLAGSEDVADERKPPSPPIRFQTNRYVWLGVY